MSSDEAERARLRRLARVVERKARHLAQPAERLFREDLGAECLARLEAEPELAERIDAFTARFGRLQDTAGGRLLPPLLRALGEPVGPVLDNWDRAERFGWIPSARQWMEARALCDRLVPAHADDPAQLADALDRARELVPLLTGAAERLCAELLRRGWP